MLRLLTRHLRRLLPARPPALRQRPLAEQMEPRLLYSADLSPAGLFSGAAMPAAETRTLDAPTADWLATESTQDLSRELLIVDSGVEDADALIDELRATRPTLDVVFLDSTRDGVEQIGSILSQYSNLGAVHILSHGSAGQLLLGNSVLDAASLESRSASIADWSRALGADADILLYGCDVAAGEEGLYFIDRFARLTGADVAASTDRTGATTAGGNWVLEQRTGAIEAATLASFSWQGSLGVTAVSGDIALSSPTGGTQDNVAVAMLDNGVWLAVWESDTSLTGKGIFGRLYNADGTARGAQFTVNGTTLGDQTTPAVASDGSGGFVVSWVSNHGFDKDVYVRRFDATGNPLTGEILVTSGNFDATTGDQFTPSVAMASNGDFVVAWSGNGLADNEGVYARRFSSNGTPKAEGVLTVNTFISNKQVTPSVAMADDGRFVITWMDEGQNKRIFARTYDSSASAGSVISVQQTRYGDAKGPDVAMDASGNFVVVWAEVNIDSGHAVRMQRFGADGAFSGTPITVNTYTSNDQENPRISMNARGDLVIAWESNGQDTDSESIVMKSFLSGSVTGTEILVNGYFKDTQEIPDIALNNAGQLVVAWQGEAQAATSDDEDVSAKTYTWPESATANAAPALNTSTTLVLAAINEDAPAPVGAVGWSVTDLVSLNTSGSGPQNVSDSNSSAVTGIALTAVDATNGQWRYSTDNGVNWTLIDAATLSSTNALLLTATSQTRLHYTPNANTNGNLAAAVSFRAWDRSSGSNGALADTSSNGGTTAFSTSIGSASLNVVAVNDAPTVVAIDLGNINEDSVSFTITQAMLLIGASDIEGDTLTAINLSTAPANGTLTDNLDGTWTYSPTANLNGPVSFSFGVSDGTDTTLNSAALNVVAQNDAPTVVAIDLGDIDEDNSITITQAMLLAGAADIDGDALTAVNLSTAPANGTLTDNLDGTWTYTPTANLNGPVSFSFGVSDGTDTTLNSAALNVVAQNDAPTVVAIDLGDIDEDNSITITQAMLLIGAADIDGDALTAVNLSTAPANGALTDNLDGTWTYTPTANLNGPVSFSFGVSDGTTTTANTASLNVVAVNDAPTVVAIDLGNIDEDSGSFTITQAMLLIGASDIDGDALTAINLSTAPANGALTDNLDGTWTYTPTANLNGPVSFSFGVSDGTTTTANTASLNVIAVNDAPTVVAIDLGNIDEDSGSFTITQAILLAGASDIDGDALTAINLSTAPANGALTDNLDGTWTYTPTANLNGPVSFSFGVSDGTTTTANTASLNVVAVNDTPTVVAIDLGNIDEDSGSFTITQAMLLAGASDIDGDALTAVNLTVSGGTATGTLTAIGGGSWTYTPAANSNGSVIFAFEVSDGTTTTANTASLNVVAINDAPTVVAIDMGNINEDSGSFTITQAMLLAGASDIDGDALTAVNLTVSGGTATGTLTAIGGGSWTYTPAANSDGSVTFAFEVSDGTTTTANTASLNVVAINDAPTVVAIDLGNIDEDSGSFTITQAMLLAGAADIDGDALTAVNLTVSGGTATGTLTAIGGGSWTYTPAANSNGSVTFAFEVSDGTTTTANTAALNINAINDAPTVSTIGSQNITAGEGFGPLGFVIGDVDTSVTTLVVKAYSSNQTVVPDTAVQLSGGGTNRTLSVLAGHGGGAGTTTIVIEVDDGFITTRTSFTVNAVSPPVPAVETAPPAAPEPAPSPPAEPVVREEASRAEPTDTAAEAPVAPAAPAAQVLAEAPLPQIVLTQETNDAVASVDIVEDGAIVPVSLSLSDTDVLALLYSSPDLSATRTLESEVSRSLREARMEQAFADLRNAADQEARGERQTVAVATVTGAGLTIGYVAWIIRGGVLVSSLLTTMPAWRLLDPLPILGNSRQSDTGDDDSLESLVDGTPENPPEPVHTPEITPAAPASAQQQEARQ